MKAEPMQWLDNKETLKIFSGNLVNGEDNDNEKEC